MVAIRLSVVIGADRRLVVNLPDDTPLGPAELEIRLVETTAAEEREALRARLLAEGLIVRPEDMGIPDDLEYVSDEEVEAMVLPPGTPTSEELIDLDRGPR